MTLGSTEAVKRAVAAGLGVSVVLRLSVAEQRMGSHDRLIVKPLQPALHKPLHLVWRSGLTARHALLSHLLDAAGH
jgi:DNA-binding transcriptional LysR family regulator